MQVLAGPVEGISFGVAGTQLGKLARDLNAAVSARLDERHCIYSAREPGRLQIHRAIYAPDGVLDGLLANPKLIRRRALTQAHHRSAERKAFAHSIVGAGSKQRFLLHLGQRVLLIVDFNVAPGSQVAGVGDVHRAALIVHHIVDALLQLGAS